MLSKIAPYIQKSKQIVSHINPRKLGCVLPNGNINFLDEKTALEYAENKIVQCLRTNGTEYGVLVKGPIILEEAGGTKNAVNISAMENLKRRFFDNSDLKRDVIMLHGHSDFLGAGKTFPLSPFGGDLEMAFAAKLKSIIALNSRGEFNRIDFPDNFSKDAFRKLENTFAKFLTKKEIPKEDLKKLKKIRNLEKNRKNIPSHLQKWLESYSKRETEKIKGKKWARFLHEFYEKYTPKCGLKYTTNFNNLY